MEKSHWNGKLWHAYGTSMTAEDKNAPWKYVPRVVEFSGMTVVNHGIGGGCLSPDGYSHGVGKNAIMCLDDGKTEADLITVEVLPNEDGSIVGDIYDTDDVSFCGCLNQCLRYLQENTSAQIVLIIMIGSNYLKPEDNFPDKTTTVFEFAQKVELVGKLNSVPVINAFSESGFGYARVKDKKYQLDNIHLNEIGGKNMASYIWSKLKQIPLWYTE